MFVVNYDEWRVYWGPSWNKPRHVAPDNLGYRPNAMQRAACGHVKAKDANRLVSIRLFASDGWRLWDLSMRCMQMGGTRGRQVQKPSGKARAVETGWEQAYNFTIALWFLDGDPLQRWLIISIR